MEKSDRTFEQPGPPEKGRDGARARWGGCSNSVQHDGASFGHVISVMPRKNPLDAGKGDLVRT